MADYCSWPLWVVGPTGPGNVDPGTLPLSPELRADLDAWAARFDAILDQDHPRDSAFASGEDEQDFVWTGRQLASRVAEELKGEYRVCYYDRAVRALIPVS